MKKKLLSILIISFFLFLFLFLLSNFETQVGQKSGIYTKEVFETVDGCNQEKLYDSLGKYFNNDMNQKEFLIAVNQYCPKLKEGRGFGEKPSERYEVVPKKAYNKGVKR